MAIVEHLTQIWADSKQGQMMHIPYRAAVAGLTQFTLNYVEIIPGHMRNRISNIP